MRYCPSEKMEIIRLVEVSELPVRKTLRELGIHHSTFYEWYRRYLEKAIGEFVAYYNNHRYHEAIDNLIPADVFYGRGKKILVQREITKAQTLQLRRIKNINKPVDEILLVNENCIS